MKISDLDYYATFGNTFLHKIRTRYKILALMAVIVTVLSFQNIYIYLAVYVILFLSVILSGIPKKKVFLASLYPLIFTGIFLFSYKNLTLIWALGLVLRVLCISTCLIILVFTTPYVKIFKAMGKFLPPIMVNILFNTYRSLFIINNILDNLLTTLRLRGTPGITKPVKFLETIGNMVGFFVIKSIETSEKMYEGIKLRGYSDKTFFLEEK